MTHDLEFSMKCRICAMILALLLPKAFVLNKDSTHTIAKPNTHIKERGAWQP